MELSLMNEFHQISSEFDAWVNFITIMIFGAVVMLLLIVDSYIFR